MNGNSMRCPIKAKIQGAPYSLDGYGRKTKMKAIIFLAMLAALWAPSASPAPSNSKAQKKIQRSLDNIPLLIDVSSFTANNPDFEEDSTGQWYRLDSDETCFVKYGPNGREADAYNILAYFKSARAFRIHRHYSLDYGNEVDWETFLKPVVAKYGRPRVVDRDWPRTIWIWDDGSTRLEVSKDESHEGRYPSYAITLYDGDWVKKMEKALKDKAPRL